MVEAFKSTLEELSYADLILLMIDASEPLESIQIKYHSCREVLEQLHINPVKLLVVLNKIDLIQKDQLKEKLPVFGDLSTIGISAKTGEGTKKLRIRIAQRVYGEEDVSGGTDQTVSEELEQKESIDRRSA